jgi:hypothetical protein
MPLQNVKISAISPVEFRKIARFLELNGEKTAKV